MVELVVGTVDTVVVVALAVQHTAEPAVDVAAAGAGVAHTAEAIAAVAHRSLAAAAGAIGV